VSSTQRRQLLALLAAVIIVGTTGGATWFLLTHIAAPSAPFLTVVGPTKTEQLSLAQLQGMTSYQGWGTVVKSAANPVLADGPHLWVGVNLSSVLNLVGPLPSDYTATLHAVDDYTLLLTYSQAEGNFTLWEGTPPVPSRIGRVQPLIAYSMDGQPIKGSPPVCLAFVNATTHTSAQAPMVDGKLWIKWIDRIAVEAFQEWELEMHGLVNYTMNGGDFESGAACLHHSQTYTVNDHTYMGLPLWDLIAWIDQYSPAGHFGASYNESLSAQNYTILLFDGAGRNVSLISSLVGYNNHIILACRVDGVRLGSPDWPLKLVGDDVPLTSQLGNIIRIELTNLP
jgi:hypothetical protein